MTGSAGPEPARIPLEEFDQLLKAAPFAGLTEHSFAVGVSGGVDSTALAYLLYKLKPIGAVTVLTVDHGLRPEATAEAEQVKGQARQFGFPHETLRWTGEKPESDIQSAARDARYRLMTDWCRDHGVQSLFVAHTQDDQAETFLLRLARGSGVDGLSAMAPVTEMRGVRLVRPLLGFRKARLEATLKAAGISWIEDPSNRNDQFARVRMRTIMPVLAEDGFTVERLAATAGRMAMAKAALDRSTRELRDETVQAHEAGFYVVDLSGFSRAPKEIGLRLLAELSGHIGGAVYRPRFDRLQRIYDAIRDDTLGNGATLAGCRFVPAPASLSGGDRVPALLIFRELAAAREQEIGLTPGEPIRFDGRFAVSLPQEAKSGPFSVKVLGEEGWQQVKSLVETSLPYDVCLTVPALWLGNRVIAAPHLGLDPDQEHGCTHFSAVFRGFGDAGKV